MEPKDFGEFTCDKCYGLGYVNVQVEPISITVMSGQFKYNVPGFMDGDPCDKCKGTGTIDWITKMRRGL